jgi:hypothetical protein
MKDLPLCLIVSVIHLKFISIKHHSKISQRETTKVACRQNGAATKRHRDKTAPRQNGAATKFGTICFTIFII